MHKIESTIPKEVLWAEKLVHWMDDAFKIPLTKFRFGLDPLLGLIPWVGDVISFLISMLILKSLVSAGLPTRLVWTMFRNIVLDFGIGLIPFLGDVWDFFNKANRKNLKLVRAYFESQTVFTPEMVATDGGWPYISHTL